jgi:HEAT repeat protein
MPRTTPAGGDFDGWVGLLGSDPLRGRARRHLLRSGPPTVPALRRGLEHPDPTVRRLCAGLLDHLVDEAALPDLVARLADDDPSVLARVLHALACDACKQNECRPDDQLFVPRAIQLLDHAHPDVRAAAIDALGKVVQRDPDPGAVAAVALTAVVERERVAGLRHMARRRLEVAERRRRRS